MGDKAEFHKAVKLVIENVSFNKNVTVQVFEVTIRFLIKAIFNKDFRVIGSLLSSHLILTNQNPFHGDFSMPDYNNELLEMAKDVATRLLPAFESTKTGFLILYY